MTPRSIPTLIQDAKLCQPDDLRVSPAEFEAIYADDGCKVTVADNRRHWWVGCKLHILVPRR
jgi:hypothetical protein